MVELTSGESEGICLGLNQSYRQCCLADDVVRYCPLWKQCIVVLSYETCVYEAELKLRMSGKVVEKLYVGVETYNL